MMIDLKTEFGWELVATYLNYVCCFSRVRVRVRVWWKQSFSHLKTEPCRNVNLTCTQMIGGMSWQMCYILPWNKIDKSCRNKSMASLVNFACYIVVSVCDITNLSTKSSYLYSFATFSRFYNIFIYVLFFGKNIKKAISNDYKSVVTHPNFND